MNQKPLIGQNEIPTSRVCNTPDLRTTSLSEVLPVNRSLQKTMAPLGDTEMRALNVFFDLYELYVIRFAFRFCRGTSMAISVQSKIWRQEGNGEKHAGRLAIVFCWEGMHCMQLLKKISCIAHTTVVKMLATVVRLTPNRTAKSSIGTLSHNFIIVNNSWSSNAIRTVQPW